MKALLEVWMADVAGVGTIPRTELELLDQGELKKSTELRVVSDRRRYLLSRILLRKALSKLFGGAPASWRFLISKSGKPALEQKNDLPPVDFNISHSGSAVVVAISSGCQVGVDIEKSEEIKHPLWHMFTEREMASLEAKAPGSRWQEALRLWTVKEAYAKFLGLGLDIDFCDFEVSLLARRIRHCSSAAAAKVHLETHDVTLKHETYHLALVANPLTGPRLPTVMRFVDPLLQMC